MFGEETSATSPEEIIRSGGVSGLIELLVKAGYDKRELENYVLFNPKSPTKVYSPDKMSVTDYLTQEIQRLQELLARKEKAEQAGESEPSRQISAEKVREGRDYYQKMLNKYREMNDPSSPTKDKDREIIRQQFHSLANTALQQTLEGFNLVSGPQVDEKIFDPTKRGGQTPFIEIAISHCSRFTMLNRFANSLR